MMKNGSLPTLLALAVSFLMSSCKSVKEPELKGIGNIKILKLNPGSSELALDLYYYNPNNYRLKLKKAEGDARINGQQVGHFIVDSLVHIDALSDFQLPAKMKMDIGQITQNVMAILLNNEVTLSVDGVARVGKGPVFINYPIHYEGKQNLKELLK